MLTKKNDAPSSRYRESVRRYAYLHPTNCRTIVSLRETSWLTWIDVDPNFAAASVSVFRQCAIRRTTNATFRRSPWLFQRSRRVISAFPTLSSVYAILFCHCRRSIECSSQKNREIRGAVARSPYLARSVHELRNGVIMNRLIWLALV